MSPNQAGFSLENCLAASSNFVDLEGACKWASDVRESHRSPVVSVPSRDGELCADTRPASPLPSSPVLHLQTAFVSPTLQPEESQAGLCVSHHRTR